MAEQCFQCGRPATAGTHPEFPQRGKCVRCAAITIIEIPVNPERRANVPDSIHEGGAWALAERAAVGRTLWLHQAKGLAELEKGSNIVVATSTASGKTLVFQLWTMTGMKRNPGATALVFYPTKALANDQARRWQECCAAVGMPPETVGQIDGDVDTGTRNEILRKARIILATPDVTHAWMLPRTADPAISTFLRNLMVMIIDEAHTYESVFGSNSAYLFRRLTTAALAAGAETTPRFIAATATIQNPDEHLEKLTGEPFRVIEEEDNGAPRHARELYHVPMEQAGRPEEQLAKLVEDIIDNDEEAQVIAFHDSRMGVERIVQTIGRPREVLPYRSGYLAQDRRAIESKLRGNSIRGVIATSALELGIDMPDLNYGIQLDLPPSRKQFHQRLGRVGRSKPGCFIMLAPHNRFSNYGETLREYYANSVEPSHLYLDNEQINYQQALCLKDEMERSGRDTRIPPGHTAWPEAFEGGLKNAHGRPPNHLINQSQLTGASHQVANKLRSSGEEELQILAGDGRPGELIGNLNVKKALEEAYPGAIYRHRGISYRIEGWARKSDTHKGFVRARRIDYERNRTTPLKRNVATLFQDPALTMRRRRLQNGLMAEARITVTESVEGYEETGRQTITRVVRYLEETERDPRLSRKQLDIPTTAVQIRINEPWFAGQTGAPWQARHQIAVALRMHLAYQRSIALPELGYRVENVFQETPQGYVELDDSILIHDNIRGGMGLVHDLYENIRRYARNLPADDGGEPGTVHPQHLEALIRWVEREPEETGEALPAPGPSKWWRVIRQGSAVQVFSSRAEEMAPGEIVGYEWRNAVVYLVSAGGETIEARDNQIRPGSIRPDWQIWKPESDTIRDLQLA